MKDMARKLVLRQCVREAIKHDFCLTIYITDKIPPQMKNLNIVISIRIHYLTHFLQIYSEYSENVLSRSYRKQLAAF